MTSYTALECCRKSFRSARCAFSNASPSLSKMTNWQCSHSRVHLFLDSQEYNIWLAWTRSKLGCSKYPSSELLNPRSTATGLQLRLNLEESSGIRLVIGNVDGRDSSVDWLETSFLMSLFDTCTGVERNSSSSSLRFAWVSLDVSSTLTRTGTSPLSSCTGSFDAQCWQFLHGWM